MDLVGVWLLKGPGDVSRWMRGERGVGGVRGFQEGR